MPVTKSGHDRSEKKTQAIHHDEPTHTIKAEVTCHSGAKLIHEKHVAGEPDSEVQAGFHRESIEHFRATMKPGDGFDNSASSVMVSSL